jgi:sterol desaturase/sphingolipid hydroxylase (fatty acid hydroxylase superfamily)
MSTTPDERTLPLPEPGNKRPNLTGFLLGAVATGLFIGALATRENFIVGLALLIVIFVPLEKIFALRPQRVLRRGWRTDMVHLAVNSALVTAVVFALVGLVGGVLKTVMPEAVTTAVHGQPEWLQIVEVLAVAHFGAYWGHRLAHQVPLLWRFHKVHHSIREMDWLAAGRLHPLDQGFIRSCAVLPAYALGYSEVSLGGYVLIQTLHAILLHANVRFTFGPLRWIIASPEYHHWHHANHPEHYNKNYSEIPLLDLLFGTAHVTWRQHPRLYGVDEQPPSGYLRQLAWPFRRANATR